MATLWRGFETPVARWSIWIHEKPEIVVLEPEFWCGRRDSNPHPQGLSPAVGDTEKLLNEFREFCRIDLQLSKRTFEDGHVPFVEHFLRTVSKPIQSIQAADVRLYLSDLKSEFEAKTYNNHLGALKRFFRDFLQRPDLINTFRFAPVNEKPIIIPRKEDLQRFYGALDEIKYRLLFLLYATSGLRRNEILTLRLEDVDRQRRMITPNGHETGRTKHSWVSFYGAEAELLFNEYLMENGTMKSRLFGFEESAVRKAFKRAEAKTGVRVTPQQLREWFCNEMGKLGVADRFVDAFCGRLPKSVLARRYSDYNPDNLGQIYGRADIKVLS